MRWGDRVIQRWRIAQARSWIQPGERVLDIGCADGALFHLVPGIRGIGVDPDLAAEPSSDDVLLIRGIFPDAIPVDEPFDVITLLAVLEHVPRNRQDAFAQACAERLRPGGRLVITVPSPAVDTILEILRFVRLADGMSLEQHYGFDPRSTPSIFLPHGFELLAYRRFQLGLNNLYVFRRRSV